MEKEIDEKEKKEMEDEFKIKLVGKNPDAENVFVIVSKNNYAKLLDYKWYLSKSGYPYTYINGSRVQLHKYVWYMNNGYLPHKDLKLFIDHINRNKLDARIENLRLSTPAENSYNKTPKSKIIDPTTNEALHHIKLTKSGYRVSLSKNGNTNTIDKIGSLEEAKEIYNMMAIEMFGEFGVLYE